MTRLVVSLVALLLTLAPAWAQDAWRDPFAKAERLDTDRIIGGRVVPEGGFPAALQLATTAARPIPGFELREGHACGATVIAPRWALTAAHCLIDLQPAQVILRGGTTALGAGGKRVTARQLVRHENYRFSSAENDIALVEMNEPLELPAVTLPDGGLGPELLRPRTGGAVVVGWGNTRWSDAVGAVAISPRLLQAQIDTLAPQFCREAYPGMPGDGSQFCAGVVDRCTADGACPDSCQGDSGGPLFAPHALGLLQIGIVSYGDRCGMRGRPGVYTSVAHFAAWIRRHVPEANFAGPAAAFAPVSGTLANAAGPPPVAALPAFRPIVTLSLPGGTRVARGQPVSVRLMSNVPGRLLLFNENAAGEGALILPNAESRLAGTARERVRPGAPLLVPDPLLDGYEFLAAPPVGRQRLVAIVVPEGAAGIDALLAPYLAGGRIADIRAWASGLAAKLPSGRVALGEAGYEIVP